jgi:hypothetical protein|tara:strand:- start:374 stop:763 length:390 start_codon:yes stop_codon:yes gene_type:complete
MSLIPMNAEQLRRQGIKNAQMKEEQVKQFQHKVEQMSKHNVGSLYDIRAIKNSKQLKEQKVYFDPAKVNAEFEDMLTYNRLITKKQNFLDHLKSLGHSTTDAHSLRLWTRIVDEMIGDFRLAYDVKESR